MIADSGRGRAEDQHGLAADVAAGKVGGAAEADVAATSSSTPPDAVPGEFVNGNALLNTCAAVTLRGAAHGPLHRMPLRRQRERLLADVGRAELPKAIADPLAGGGIGMDCRRYVPSDWAPLSRLRREIAVIASTSCLMRGAVERRVRASPPAGSGHRGNDFSRSYSCRNGTR